MLPYYKNPGTYSKLNPKLEMIDSYMRLQRALEEIDPISGHHVLAELEPYIHQNKKIKFGKKYSAIINNLIKDDFCANVLKKNGVKEDFEIYIPGPGIKDVLGSQGLEDEILISREPDYEAPKWHKIV